MSENDGNSTFVPEPPYLKKYWLVCESLLVILTVVALYLTVRLMQYACDRKFNSKTGREIVQKKWLKGLCATSSLAYVLRLISNHFVAFLGWQSDELCYATVTASTVMFCAALYPIYIFLWVRQSIFYTNPVIRKGLNVWVTRISWFTLVFMILTGLTLAVLYNVPAITGWEYRATENGCMEVSEDSVELVPAISVAFTIIFQVVLLGLFIYPLLSKEMAKFRAPKSASPSKSIYNGKSNSLSKSDETKRQDSEQEEYHDNAFYPTSRPGSPLVRPMSPLAMGGRQNFTFERTPRASETDNESTGMPDNIVRNDNKRNVSAGGHNYTRAQTQSGSSGQVTPAMSDAEQPKLKANAFWGTIKRVRQHRKSTKRHDEERRKRKEGRRLIIMMKNYSRLMAFCVATDAITAGIQIAWVIPELIYLVMFDINILINLICIVLTYAEWQVIIFPCSVDHDDEDSEISTPKLRRRPTPIRRRAKRPDRVQELKREGKKSNSASYVRSPSGSGYESGDSCTQMCRPAVEMRPLRQTSKL